MHRILSLSGLIVALATGSAAAGEWAMRAGDSLFDRSALGERVAGKTLTFYDNGRSIFAADGTYQWIYAGGGTWYGRYEVGEDSTICITFVTEVTRCDLYVKNGGRLILITEEGRRFPVRPDTAADG